MRLIIIKHLFRLGAVRLNWHLLLSTFYPFEYEFVPILLAKFFLPLFLTNGSDHTIDARLSKQDIFSVVIDI